MKKYIFLIFILIISIFKVNAQSPTFDDLLILFASEEYEKVISKAEKYTKDKKTTKQPLPYYFIAHSLYEMSKDTKFTSEPKYKNAFKNCLGFIGRCRKKDKDNSVYDDKKEFFSQVKKDVVEIIVNELASGGHARSKGWIYKLYKVSPKDVGGQFLLTAISLIQGDRSTANDQYKAAKTDLENIKNTSGWNPEDFEMLRIGIVECADAYIKNRQEDKAKKLMKSGYKFLSNDEEFKIKYDEIVQ